MCTTRRAFTGGICEFRAKAIQSVNAMYEYPSYDYRGNFKITVDPSQIKQNVKAENTAKLDAELQKKVDQYLREQKVALSKAQKQTLYAAIANEQGDLGLTSSARSEKLIPYYLIC